MPTVRASTPKNKSKLHFIINGKITEEKHGWKSLHIWGKPFERGFAHGHLLYKELKTLRKKLKFLVKEQIHIPFSEFTAASKKIITPILQNDYPEYYAEICGISSGAKHAGTTVTIELLVAWNAFLSLYSYFMEGREQIERCSAFIATGNATKNGDIIMSHNTHTDLLTGQMANIVLKITPSVGYEFVMQTSVGLICSATDWYISKSGIVCCETTIADIKYSPKFGFPFFCRIRDTIQYASSLDECITPFYISNADFFI
jgi:hypothetical protein